MSGRKPGEASAQSVSRALKAAGYRTVADFKREGMRVRQGMQGLAHVHELGVSVVAQYNTPSMAERYARDAEGVLFEAGYNVTRKGVRLNVSKPVSPSRG